MTPARAFLFLAVLASAFGASQFFRTAAAVLAPELRRELALSPEGLGLVAGLFFVAFAAVHLPIGALLDRFGPRRTMSVLLVLAAAGAFVFAAGRDVPTLIAGQLLLGAGCSVAFVGGLAAVARWFPPERFSVLGSLLTAISTLGTILSGTPFAALVEAIGWRDAYRVAGGATLLVAVTIFLLVRDAPPGHPFLTRRPERFADTLRGIGEVLRVRQVWGIVALAFVGYAVQIAVRGLWGGPYLADVHGLDAIQRGNVLLAMSVCGTAVALLYGWLEYRGVPRVALILTGSLSVAAIYLLLAAVPLRGAWTIGLVFCAIGAAGPYTILLITHARALFPDRLTGRAITSVNVANFFGVAVMQVAPGWLLGAFEPVAGHPPEAAYRTMFALLAAVSLIGIAIFLRWGARGR